MAKRSRAALTGITLALLACLTATGCTMVVVPQGESAPSADTAAPTADANSPRETARGSAGAKSEEPSDDRCTDGTLRRDLRVTAKSGKNEYLGHVVEPHGATYDLRAVLTDDGCTITGSFEYVELQCSGTWTPARIEDVREGSNGPWGLRVDLIERVTSDPHGSCAAQAEVQLVQGPAGLFYSSNWIRDDGQATDSRTHLDLVN